MSHIKLAQSAAILVPSVAAVVALPERIWRSGGDCNEGNKGKKSEEAGEHVWQSSGFLET